MSMLTQQLQPGLMHYARDQKEGRYTLEVGALRDDTIAAISAKCKQAMTGYGARADAMGLSAQVAAMLGRSDSGGGLALERELTRISTVTSMQPLPKLTSLSLIGLTPDSPEPGDKSYTSTGMTSTGNRLSYAYTDRGGSAAQSRSELVTNKISPIIQFASYTIDDMYAATRANIPLPMLQMATAKRLVETKANDWNFYGDTTLGITGLYNLTGVTPTVVANGGNASPLWTSKTPLEIFADVVDMVKAVWAAIDGGDTNIKEQASILRPNRLAISATSYFILATTPMAANAATWGQSILMAVEAALKAVSPDFQIIATPEMNTGGGGSGAWMACWSDHPEVLGRVVALPGQFGVPTIESFTTAVPYHTQVGGVQSRFPVGIAIRYGM